MNSVNSQPSLIETRPAGEATKIMNNPSATANPGTASDKTTSQASLDAFEQSRIAFFSK